MLFSQLIENKLEDKRIVLSDGVHDLTYKEIYIRAAQYCAVFQSKGVKKGERIVVINKEPLETVLILMACIAKGYIFVPIEDSLDEGDRLDIIHDCQPTIVVDSSEIPEAAAGIRKQEYLRQRDKLPQETLVYIVYTSGTEGKAKGVVASQKQVFFCTHAINCRLEHTKMERILCSLPLSFDYGLYQVFLAFLSGAYLYVDKGDILQRLPYVLKHNDITAFPTIPTVANLLVRTWRWGEVDFPCLRYISFTGEVLSVSLIEELKGLFDGVRIIPMYGLTECKRVSVMPVGREDKIMEGSCGLPLEGIRVYLKDRDPQTEIGELVVEGDNVMEGYWNDSEINSEIFSVNLQTGKRVLFTGDFFKIDREGFLYFYGRKKGILKIRGYRVSSVWIENKLKKIKEVLEVAVVGELDEFTGERAAIHAYVLQENAREKIMECMQSMPQYLQNYKIYLYTEMLPRNLNGKISVNSRKNEILRK